MRIFSPHWSLETAGWSVEPSDECVTLQPADYDVALQISSYVKNAGNVTDEDLMLPWGGTFEGAEYEPVDVVLGPYVGVYAEFELDEIFWRVWSLRWKNVNMFVTFNCDPSIVDYHRDVVDWMLGRIEPGSE